MRMRSLLRDVALLCVAVLIGWWARGANTAVMAKAAGSGGSSASGGDGGMGFQLMGTGPDAALAVYNQGSRTLYVYTRVGAGNSSVACSYGLTIANPGAAIRRENCPAGELVH
jgi:hypothetical protein